MNLLKQLELDELSLVDRPANAQAKVALFKRDSNEDDMEKAYKMNDAEMTEMDKMSDDLKAKLRGHMKKGYTFNEAKKMVNDDMKMKKSEDELLEIDETDVLQAEVDTLKVDNERLRKSLTDNGFIVKSDKITKKEEVETIDVNGVSVVKSDAPEAILYSVTPSLL